MLNGQERLILATQTFSLETVWMQGYAAGMNKYTSTCPYGINDKEYQYWNEGHDSAILGDDPLFPEYTVCSKIPSNDELATQSTSKVKFEIDQQNPFKPITVDSFDGKLRKTS
ncbi:hypothetical protein [Cysteiniphilum marinum]|uniref:hypothetical protein n=1 Tax=Cysteiniphilum marinum TaxID=2774191 RepID=UPI0019398BCA|nr:hypothetical protein [Cysteiniphilum marinum]